MYFVCFLVISVAVVFPYHFAFLREFPESLDILILMVLMFYIADVVVQVITAIEDEDGKTSYRSRWSDVK